MVSHFLATIFKIELWLTPGFIDMVLVHRTNMFKISENHVITTYDVINEFRFIFAIDNGNSVEAENLFDCCPWRGQLADKVSCKSDALSCT